MAIVKNFEPPVVDDVKVFPSLEAAHYAACVMIQMLVDLKGPGPWVDEMHESMRKGLDSGPPPKGWPFGVKRWRDGQHSALNAIFAHQHMVGSVRPKN